MRRRLEVAGLSVEGGVTEALEAVLATKGAVVVMEAEARVGEAQVLHANLKRHATLPSQGTYVEHSGKVVLAFVGLVVALSTRQLQVCNRLRHVPSKEPEDV